MSRCMLGRTDANRYFLVVETQKEPSMRFTDSIFASLLEPINRRQFQTVVDGSDGDAYDKSFKSWDHLVALIYAQLSGADGLRRLVAGFNANSQHHYHLGTDSCPARHCRMPMHAVLLAFFRKPSQGCRRWPIGRC